MKPTCIRGLALAGLLVAGPAAAEGFALGVKAGTLGAGVEATYGLSERFNLRFGLNGYKYEYEETASDIRYDAELDLASGAAMLDWHPFAGVFRVSLGYVRNDNRVLLTATPTGTVDIGGQDFSPAQVGTLSGEVTFEENVPYFGVGWGNAARAKRLGFSVELGAMFQDAPEVSLSSTSADPMLQSRLGAEEREIEQDLENFEIYPVVSLGLSYRF